MIPIEYFLGFAAILFVIGAYGVMTAKNGIVVLMSVEIMLNAANMNFITFSSFFNDSRGQAFALISMAIAAAEVAVGLAILLNLYKSRGTTDIDEVNIMRW